MLSVNAVPGITDQEALLYNYNYGLEVASKMHVHVHSFCKKTTSRCLPGCFVPGGGTGGFATGQWRYMRGSGLGPAMMQM